MTFIFAGARGRDRGEVETPGSQIIRKLTIERIEELKKLVQEEQDKYKLVLFFFVYKLKRIFFHNWIMFPISEMNFFHQICNPMGLCSRNDKTN